MYYHITCQPKFSSFHRPCEVHTECRSAVNKFEIESDITDIYIQRRPSNSIQCKRNKINEMDWIVLALLIHSNNRPPALEVRLELVSLHGVATFWLFYMHICQITNWYFTKQAETVASSFRSIDIQANFSTTKFWTYRF